MSEHPKHAHHMHHSGKHHPLGQHPHQAEHHPHHEAHHAHAHHAHPRLIVVDKEDNVIAHKHWGKLEPEDIHRASFLWITNSHGQVLLSQRSHHVHNPGLWTAAASGTVGEDETYEQNIYKEAEEELGLTGISFYQGPKILIDLHEDPFFIQWFVAMLDRDVRSFHLARSEVLHVKWMDRDAFQQSVDQHPELYAPAVPLWKHLWA